MLLAAFYPHLQSSCPHISVYFWWAYMQKALHRSGQHYGRCIPSMIEGIVRIQDLVRCPVLCSWGRPHVQVATLGWVWSNDPRGCICLQAVIISGGAITLQSVLHQSPAATAAARTRPAKRAATSPAPTASVTRSQVPHPLCCCNTYLVTGCVWENRANNGLCMMRSPPIAFPSGATAPDT